MVITNSFIIVISFYLYYLIQIQPLISYKYKGQKYKLNLGLSLKDGEILKLEVYSGYEYTDWKEVLEKISQCRDCELYELIYQGTNVIVERKEIKKVKMEVERLSTTYRKKYYRNLWQKNCDICTKILRKQRKR